MKKNNYLRFPLTLFIICFLSSSFLAVVYKITQPEIKAQMLGEIEGSLNEVVPQASSFKSVQYEDSDEIYYYEALDKKRNIMGYAFKTQKKGYSSVIETMVGIKTNGEIVNIKIISQNETPGLGTKIEEVIDGESRPWFQAQFSGREIKGLNDEIQIVTGATISSKAVIDSIKEKVREILEVAGNE